MKYVLVLDVAKGKSMFMLSSNVGEVLLEPIEYTHNKSNFKLIDSNITKLNNEYSPQQATGYLPKAMLFLLLKFQI